MKTLILNILSKAFFFGLTLSLFLVVFGFLSVDKIVASAGCRPIDTWNRPVNGWDQICIGHEIRIRAPDANFGCGVIPQQSNHLFWVYMIWDNNSFVNTNPGAFGMSTPQYWGQAVYGFRFEPRTAQNPGGIRMTSTFGAVAAANTTIPSSCPAGYHCIILWESWNNRRNTIAGPPYNGFISLVNSFPDPNFQPRSQQIVSHNNRVQNWSLTTQGNTNIPAGSFSPMPAQNPMTALHTIRLPSLSGHTGSAHPLHNQVVSIWSFDSTFTLTPADIPSGWHCTHSTCPASIRRDINNLPGACPAGSSRYIIEAIPSNPQTIHILWHGGQPCLHRRRCLPNDFCTPNTTENRTMYQENWSAAGLNPNFEGRIGIATQLTPEHPTVVNNANRHTQRAQSGSGGVPHLPFYNWFTQARRNQMTSWVNDPSLTNAQLNTNFAGLFNDARADIAASNNTPHLDLTVSEANRLGIQEGSLYRIATEERRMSAGISASRQRVRRQLWCNNFIVHSQNCTQTTTTGPCTNAGANGGGPSFTPVFTNSSREEPMEALRAWEIFPANNAAANVTTTPGNWTTTHHRQLLSARCNLSGMTNARTHIGNPNWTSDFRRDTPPGTTFGTPHQYFGMILSPRISAGSTLPFRSSQNPTGAFTETNGIGFFNAPTNCNQQYIVYHSETWRESDFNLNGRIGWRNEIHPLSPSNLSSSPQANAPNSVWNNREFQQITNNSCPPDEVHTDSNCFHRWATMERINNFVNTVNNPSTTNQQLINLYNQMVTDSASAVLISEAQIPSDLPLSEVNQRALQEGSIFQLRIQEARVDLNFGFSRTVVSHRNRIFNHMVNNPISITGSNLALNVSVSGSYSWNGQPTALQFYRPASPTTLWTIPSCPAAPVVVDQRITCNNVLCHNHTQRCHVGLRTDAAFAPLFTFRPIETRQLVSSRCNQTGMLLTEAHGIPITSPQETAPEYFGMTLSNPITGTWLSPVNLGVGSFQTSDTGGIPQTNEISFFERTDECINNIPCVNDVSGINNRRRPNDSPRWGAHSDLQNNNPDESIIVDTNRFVFARDNQWNHFELDRWRPQIPQYISTNSPRGFWINRSERGGNTPTSQPSENNNRDRLEPALYTQIRLDSEGTPIGNHEFFELQSRPSPSLRTNAGSINGYNFWNPPSIVNEGHTLTGEYFRFRTRASWASDFGYPHRMNVNWIHEGGIRGHSPTIIAGGGNPDNSVGTSSNPNRLNILGDRNHRWNDFDLICRATFNTNAPQPPVYFGWQDRSSHNRDIERANFSWIDYHTVSVNFIRPVGE